MRLRRVTEHVRDQNWTAVVIDFVIVVVGVFIGIQVANWNDERIRTDDAIEARSRLIADLQGDRDAFAVRKKFYGEVFDAALRVGDALQADLPSDTQGLWQFVYDAWRAGGEWAFGPSGQVYRELQNTGKLDFIVDPTVLRQLRDYYEDGARELKAQTPFRSNYHVRETGLIEGRAVIHMAECFTQTEFEPSNPNGANTVYFKECPPPQNTRLITTSATNLRGSKELPIELNTRIADLVNMKILVDYLDGRADSLISQLESSAL